jgi:glycosyltransferase involved in cell wall biosynthesis
MGADVRVLSLTRGDALEPEVRALGLEPVWIGRRGSPPLRLVRLLRELRHAPPVIVHATHFFANLYAAAAARWFGAVSLGSVRNDVIRELQMAGRWGQWQLRAPTALIANSLTGCENAKRFGIPDRRVHYLPNVIDLERFDREAGLPTTVPSARGPIAVAVANPRPAKRLDRFLHALAAARRRLPVTGWIVGDGPSRPDLEILADSLGLLPDGVRFLGTRGDVPALLRRADLLVLTSDHEGSPNVILEAMAARRPVVATPAGDVRSLVVEGVTGHVVEPDDATALTDRIVELATDSARRTRFGEAGRARVESEFAPSGLPMRLRRIYDQVAEVGGAPVPVWSPPSSEVD